MTRGIFFGSLFLILTSQTSFGITSWPSCSTTINSISGGRGTRGKVTMSGFCLNKRPMRPAYRPRTWQKHYTKRAIEERRRAKKYRRK